MLISIKKRYFFFIRVTCFILLVLLPLPLYGSSQEFTVITEEYPPFNFEKNGKITGISTEIVREMLKRINHSDNITIMSWSEGYNLTQTKDNYMLYSTTRSPFREKLFKWVGPIVPNNTVFFKRKGSGIAINTLDDARKVRGVGVYKDDFGELFLKERGFNNLKSVLDNRDNLIKLVSGKIDLWFANRPIAIFMAKQAGYSAQIKEAFHIQEEFMYLAFSKTTPDSVIENWQSILDDMKSDGTYGEIFKRWAMFAYGKHLYRAAKRKKIVIGTVGGSMDVPAGSAVVREAYRRIGYDIEVKEFTGKEALEYSNSGKVDAELQRIDGINRRFTNLIQIPIPINLIQGSVFSKDIDFFVNGWNSLKPYKIGIVKGIIFAMEGTAGMNVTMADTYEELIYMLERGEVEIAVMPRISGLLEIRKHRHKGIKEVEGILETLFLYHYVHEKNAHLVPKLKREFKRMLIDGTTKRFCDKINKELLRGEQ